MVKVKLEGFRELERALAEEMPKATARSVMRRSALEAIHVVKIQARVRVPRDTGRLQGTIITQVVKARRARGSIRFQRSTGVEVWCGPAPVFAIDIGKAFWQEFGTVDMAANPYMRPAADVALPYALDIVRDALATNIAKTKKRIAARAAKAKG